MKPGDPAAAATRAGAAAGGDDAEILDEIHIAGVLVQCRPLDLMRVSRGVDALEAAEVFQTSAEGKLVAVIEAPTSRQVLAVLDGIRALPGVLNVALVYQHAEPAAAMRQPMDSADNPGDIPAGAPAPELPAGMQTTGVGATELKRERRVVEG